MTLNDVGGFYNGDSVSSCEQGGDYFFIVS